MEHKERQEWCRNISRINEKVNAPKKDISLQDFK